MDLIFPHHENEIAQSEALTGKPFARYWIHNGPLTREGVKMSKSLGNILSIREALERYHPEELRLFFLLAHYRKPLDFTEAGIREAQAALERLYSTWERMDSTVSHVSRGQNPQSIETRDLEEALETFPSKFVEAMDDDFNTPRAMAQVFELTRLLNQWLDRSKEPGGPYAEKVIEEARKCYGLLSRTLGILQRTPKDFRREKEERFLSHLGMTREQIEALVQIRSEARKRKDFQQADKIRQELSALGIQLFDTPEGTHWKIMPGAKA